MSQLVLWLEMKMDLGNTYNVAINLDEALANPGSASDIVMRDKDQVIVEKDLDESNGEPRYWKENGFTYADRP